MAVFYSCFFLIARGWLSIFALIYPIPPEELRDAGEERAAVEVTTASAEECRDELGRRGTGREAAE